MHRVGYLLLAMAGPCAHAQGIPHRAAVTPHSLATEAAIGIMRDGGTAADAAIAAQMVLGVVMPNGSGIGGGGMALSYDAATRIVTGWDGREAAPAAAIAPLPGFMQPVPAGGRAVGTPGLLAMLEALHREHGRLPWADLFAPAIRLANQGVTVSEPLAAAISTATGLRQQPGAMGLFLQPDGLPLLPGASLVNPALAEVLLSVAAAGADGIMRGPLAAEIATAVRGDADDGLLTTDDLAAYTARRAAPLCVPYRGHSVCSAGAPSSGGTELLQALGLLDHFDLPALAPEGVGAAMLIAEAEQLAAADAAQFVADDRFIPVPLPGLMEPDYLARRAQHLSLDHAIAAPAAGHPPWAEGQAAPETAPPPPRNEHGTASIAVVDGDGNAVCLNSSLGGSFGSRLIVHGFVLNAAMADFASQSTVYGHPVANRVEPGKRPATAMTPAMVLNVDGALLAVIGSSGGGRIPFFVLEAVTGLLDWGLDPAGATALPHRLAHDSVVELEAGTAAAGLALDLRARGQTVSIMALPSGTAVIEIAGDSAGAAADQREAGAASHE